MQYVERSQLVSALARLVELNIAPKHWKNIMIVIPRMINRSEYGYKGTGRMGERGRTIEDSADEGPGEISLLCEVEPIRNSVGRRGWWTKAFPGCESAWLIRIRQCLVPLSSEIHIFGHHPSTVLDDENDLLGGSYCGLYDLGFPA